MTPEELIKVHKPIAKTNVESQDRYKHLMYCPFTGLGLYNGFRGNRWLRNRIKIFKQFVLPSLEAQTSKEFTLWISWRPEERHNSIVKDFVKFLEDSSIDIVHTYSGVCFYDDKYSPVEANERLLTAIHGAMSELVNVTEGEFGYEWVLMTIQPSDDCYHKSTVKALEYIFRESPDLGAVGFSKGYIMNYQTRELAEWNPETNPPFYTIKFPRPVFIDPLKHVKHTALKHDAGPYKAGTPLPSHEYVKDCLKYGVVNERGFLVGTHGENISTIWKHPYKGEAQETEVLEDFGLGKVESLKLPFSLRRKVFSGLPHKIQRKLRFWAGEKKWILRPIFSLIYNGLRG